jgi:hypothetical protein
MKTLKIIGLVALILIIAVLGVRFFSGPEDIWLCQNGQWIKHGQPSAPQPTSGCGDLKQPDEVLVTVPKLNQAVNSPLTVEGQAKGNWFFEASFPIEIVDDQGNILGQSHVQAQSDWMTDGLVPFKGEINYQLAATTTGKLVLKNDNPSGLPQNDKRTEMPIIINPSKTISVQAFFSNNNLDPAISCNKVFPVSRQIVETAGVARATLEELLKGPTDADKTNRFYTSINPGVVIQKLTIEQGTAKVDFDETLEKAVGGSCRVSAIRAQITQTLKQFSTVKNVVISVNGRTADILQP